MSSLNQPVSPMVVGSSVPVKTWDLSQSTTRGRQSYTSSTWVQLFHPPTDFSFDEALLLCQQDESTWVAWVPNYGEIILSETEFVPLT